MLEGKGADADESWISSQTYLATKIKQSQEYKEAIITLQKLKRNKFNKILNNEGFGYIDDSCRTNYDITHNYTAE